MLLFSVAELNRHLREVLESTDSLRDIWVAGEISNFNRHSSGHCYFRLKGDNAVLDAVMWRSYAERGPLRIANGDAVLAHGYVSFYEPRGTLQLYTDLIQPAGVGLLHARFEQLRQQLEAEGLFDESRKRLLPERPHRIGLVTAPGGAALRDMLSVLGRRYPLAEVLIAPCLVQGERAPDSIVEALYAMYNAGVDVIILARGGGSIEDLWAFNEEVVARAVFASPVPLVTGVGHETDTTIVDFVADMRAPTPSAAAELAVPDVDVMRDELEATRRYLDMLLLARLDGERRQVAEALATLRQYAPTTRIARSRQQLDELLARANARMGHGVQLRRAHLQGVAAQLAALSPQATLERGYAVVRNVATGAVLSDAAAATPGTPIHVTFHSGSLNATVTETHTTHDT
ncbi:MAG: exodeoxyribonuclease VII large subunit [Chloroflexaceae bacterium]|jgi:exodeoxyribonuclease VII large subunit|nr:exodeoxyribonuclease VII large subunit [Chloroflexaceae bacterium]